MFRRAVFASTRAGAALVHEGHRLRTAHVAGREPLDLEAGAFDERRDRTIQEATPADAFPQRRETVLPPANGRLRGKAVLDEQEPPTRPEHPAHLLQSLRDV